MKWHHRYFFLIFAILAALALYWTSLGSLNRTEHIKVDHSKCIELCQSDYDKTTDLLDEHRQIWQITALALLILCLAGYAASATKLKNK